jgi:NO-binding membrane sensor protein with MHYT domain
MFKVLTCLAVDHDWRLVLVAAVICLVSAVTALRLYALAAAADGRVRLAWVMFGGGVAGSGIWATHFIAMLAYQPGFATGYEPAGTLLSWALAVATTGLGLGLAAGATGPLRLVAGGTVLGLGISIMHYVGMAAYRIQGVLLWDRAYVVASVLLGALLAAAAMAAAGRAARQHEQMLGAGLLTLAICSMHFTGMGAATVELDSSIALSDRVLDRNVMAIAVTTLAAVLALAAIGIVALEAAMRRSSLVRLQCAIEAIQQPLAIYDADDRLAVWNQPYAELSRANGVGALAVGAGFRDGLERGLASACTPTCAST